jgi:cell division protein FtsZ
MIHFDLPKEQSSIIKVIGVGGGGSNAVNYMFSQIIDGVNFIICNTDAQAIATSKVPNKIQLGPHLTQGLGAGANPQIGKQATEESLEEIKRILEVNTKMAFITAGMGGGTGTGGAPIIAKICKDLGILTVGIVTTPFAYEGKKRIAQAQDGIAQLKQHVDTLLVISNDKLRHQFGNLTMKAAFSKADNVLATAAKCITDVINSTGQINVDFADVCTVMRNGGVAILGSAACEGENRAQQAIEDALNSPLLNDNDIRGAKWILININSAEGDHEFTMDEVETIQQYLLSHAGDDTDVILGLGYDPSLGNKIGITLIATGFEHKNPFDEKHVQHTEEKKKSGKILMELQQTAEINQKAAATPEVRVEHKEPVDTLAPVLKETDIQLTEKTSSSQVTLDLFTEEKTNQSTPISGGYLARPSQIYAASSEQKRVEPEKVEKVEEVQQQVKPVMEETPMFDMQLIEKSTPPPAEYAKQDIPAIQAPVATMPEPQLDSEEELKRKAMDRISKLRNLSFNVNASDPNNEFEAVPAYLRRNTELHNSLADVESFYSNYTVKSDNNNQAEISTINTFLDGKRPD